MPSTSNGEEKTNGDAGDDKKKAKKPVKKTIPAWASIDSSKKKSSSMAVATGSSVAVVEEALRECANEKGLASSIAVKKCVKKKYPHWPKITFKMALKRAISQGAVVQVRGSYKLGKKKAEPASPNKAKK